MVIVFLNGLMLVCSVILVTIISVVCAFIMLVVVGVFNYIIGIGDDDEIDND